MRRIRRAARALLAGGVLLGFGPGGAVAQELQSLPEVDAHLTLNSRWRTYLQAKEDRDAGVSTQLAIGPSIQLYVKPLVRLRNVTMFDLDDAKKRALVLETGYRQAEAYYNLLRPDGGAKRMFLLTAILLFPE